MSNDPRRLYREEISKHAAEPVGYQAEINATHQYEEYNPLCGDRILLQLQISGQQVEAAAFDGEACAICMASASLLCENVSGQPVSHLESLYKGLQEAFECKDECGEPAPLRPLFGVKSFPSRIACATLPWTAAIKAL